jgi:hypothetical protein
MTIVQDNQSHRKQFAIFAALLTLSVAAPTALAFGLAGANKVTASIASHFQPRP